MINFVAAGTPIAVSRAIEQCAAGQPSVSALVVPWESDRTTLSIAVTAVTGEGWAIEHANLGTIRLTDLGDDRTRVDVVPDDTIRPDREKRASLLARFGQELQHQLHEAS